MIINTACGSKRFWSINNIIAVNKICQNDIFKIMFDDEKTFKNYFSYLLKERE